MSLPFTRDQFLDVFASYNSALWPFALALWLVSVVVVLLFAVSKKKSVDSLVSSLLVVLWSWAAVAYHIVFFSKINPAAWLFGALFLLQAGLFAWRGVIRRQLEFVHESSIRYVFSWILITYAFVYPIINWAVGYEFPALPTFGIPCPTAILTIGFLLMARPQSIIVSFIPILWAFIAGSAAGLLGVSADWVLFGAGIILLYSTIAGRFSFGSRAAAETEALFAGTLSSVGPDQMRARYDSLPEPVQRYLRYAIRGAPAIRTAHLKHDGFFRTKPGQRWFEIQGEEYFTTAKPGLVWSAKIRPLPLVSIAARDLLLSGHGNMLVKLLSTFTLANASGAAIDQGATLRWLAESIWFPYAFVADGVSWKPVDTYSACASIAVGTTTASAIVTIDDEGKLVSIRADRYRDIGGGKAIMTPWSAHCADYREFSGFRVPTSVEVGWDLESGQFTYARFHVTSLEYNASH